MIAGEGEVLARRSSLVYAEDPVDDPSLYVDDLSLLYYGDEASRELARVSSELEDERAARAESEAMAREQMGSLVTQLVAAKESLSIERFERKAAEMRLEVAVAGRELAVSERERVGKTSAEWSGVASHVAQLLDAERQARAAALEQLSEARQELLAERDRSQVAVQLSAATVAAQSQALWALEQIASPSAVPPPTSPPPSPSLSPTEADEAEWAELTTGPVRDRGHAVAASRLWRGCAEFRMLVDEQMVADWSSSDEE